jgi:cytochrome c-type biogenesis protein CcmH/NrfG
MYNLAAAYINWGNDLRDDAVKKESDDKAYLDKFKEAIPYLERYLTAKPNESRVWLSLGQVYANLGMKDKAEESFKKAEQYK